MKKTLLLFILVLIGTTFTHPVYAQQDATPSGETSRIEKFKEMLTKKVADLKLTEKRGILGTVSESSTTQIVLLDRDNKKRTVDIDELTKFIDPTNKTFGVSDIQTGDTLAIIGWYNKETKQLLARFVTKIKSMPVIHEGIISAKDARLFTITVITEDNKTYIVDIETLTKTSEYALNDILKKSGFSKLTVGERVLVNGFTDLKDANRIAASRIVRFLDIPPSPLMKNNANVVAPQNTTPTP